MKYEVRVEDAVGMVLAHDLTKIVAHEFKGTIFHKGHIISGADIPELLKIGKERIYVLKLELGEVHEDDAALRMAEVLKHESLMFTDPHEGKVIVKAAHAGLLTIDTARLATLNQIGELMVVTKRTHTYVKQSDKVAGLRVIPLIAQEEKLTTFKAIAQPAPLIEIKPFRKMSVGIVTTGSEVFYGRIQDRFGPVVTEKLAQYEKVLVLSQTIVNDNQEDIVAAIRSFIDRGADLVLVTGGMSVDPEDRSPAAIKTVADHVVSYGMPILPGSMTMLAYAGPVVLMGLPGGVIYDPFTAFDLLLPQIMAGVRPTAADIAALGHGGMLS